MLVVTRRYAELTKADALIHRAVVVAVHGLGAALTGHTPEELIGKNHWELFPESLGTGFEKALRSAAQEQRIAKATDYYAPLEKWFRVTAYPAQHGVSALFQDVIEEMEMQDRMRVADRLSTAGRMAAVITHEINNPLAALGNLLFLAKTNEDSETHGKLMQEAERQLYRAAQIAEQTLTFHRPPSERTVVDICAVINEAAALLKVRLEDARVSLQVNATGDRQTIVSSGELVQVVANLLSNAVDVSPGRGDVWVEVSHADEKVIIEVRDSGAGVPLHLLAKIFQPFLRPRRTLARVSVCGLRAISSRSTAARFRRETMRAEAPFSEWNCQQRLQGKWRSRRTWRSRQA